MARDKMGEGFPLGLVSKHRNAIYGLSIFWIVIFHAHAIDKVRFLLHEPGFYWLGRLISLGNVGVDVFLFLSGISLYYSFHKKPDIKQFYKKRFIRVFPSVWLIFGVYWAIRYFIQSFDPAAFAGRMTAMRFWVTGDESIWFVSLILLLYLAYPLVYKLLFSWKRGVVARSVLVIACAALLVFWCGRSHLTTIRKSA